MNKACMLIVAFVAQVQADCSCPGGNAFPNVVRHIEPKPGLDIRGTIFNVMGMRYKSAFDVMKKAIAKDTILSANEISWDLQSESTCFEGRLEDALFDINGVEVTAEFNMRGYALDKGVSIEFCGCKQTGGSGIDFCGEYLLDQSNYRMNDVACKFQ